MSPPLLSDAMRLRHLTLRTHYVHALHTEQSRPLVFRQCQSSCTLLLSLLGFYTPGVKGWQNWKQVEAMNSVHFGRRTPLIDL